MGNPYSTFCDDFYINMRLGSQMNLPLQRETLLHYFERMQKGFPDMARFRKTDAGETSLEEDRSTGSYRWASVEAKRMSSGHVNPPSIEAAMQLHSFVLDQAPHALGISPIEIDYLDVLFGFDLPFSGNHDEIIAESLFPESPLSCLNDIDGARAVDFQPTVTVALSDDCRLQGRIDIVTRTNSQQIRTGEYGDDAISVYMIVRRYWGDRPKESLSAMVMQLAERADALCQSHILPRVLRPISSVIASRS